MPRAHSPWSEAPTNQRSPGRFGSPPAAPIRSEQMNSTVSLFINGVWTPGLRGETLPVISPATGEPVRSVAKAVNSDLDLALDAAEKGFHAWRKISAFERSKIMRKAAELMRARVEDIAPIMTTEQGKPLSEA